MSALPREIRFKAAVNATKRFLIEANAFYEADRSFDGGEFSDSAELYQAREDAEWAEEVRIAGRFRVTRNEVIDFLCDEDSDDLLAPIGY